MEHFIGDPIVVLKRLLLGRLYVLAGHEEVWASVLRYDEPVAQLCAVPSYPSSWHDDKPNTRWRGVPSSSVAVSENWVYRGSPVSEKNPSRQLGEYRWLVARVQSIDLANHTPNPL